MKFYPEAPVPINLLICDAYEGSSVALLGARLDARVTRAAGLRPTSDELREVEGLLIRSRTQVDKSLLDQAPRLRFVVTATSGFDHIDHRECEKRDITVSYTPEANVESAAELTIGLILALARKLPLAHQRVRQHLWRDEMLRGHILAGRTLGIVGLGRIGQRVAKVAHALGMKLLACDPYQDNSVFTQHHAHRLALTELLIESDIVTLHVPLTKETKHFLNHQTLRVINPDAWVINASRGDVINENELIRAMEEGLVKGVALDVFENEPLQKDSRLRGKDNVIMTPHIGAYTKEALELASLQAVEHCIEFFKTSRCPDCLPLKTPWFEQVLTH